MAEQIESEYTLRDPNVKAVQLVKPYKPVIEWIAKTLGIRPIKVTGDRGRLEFVMWSTANQLAIGDYAVLDNQRLIAVPKSIFEDLYKPHGVAGN
jgi:hypothetical protein